MVLKKFLSIFFLITNFLFAFELRPTMFEQRIDGKGGYREFTLKNSGKTTLRYKLTILPGLGKYKDMSKWTEISPKVLVIKPGKSGKIKVFAQAPEGTSAGDYSFVVSFNMVDAPKLPHETSKIEPTAKVNFDIHVEFLGHVGDEEPKITLTQPAITVNNDKSITVKGKIKNSTETRGVYCAYDVLGPNGIISTQEIRVPKNSSKDVTITITDPKFKKGDIKAVQVRDGKDFKNVLDEQRVK